MLSLAANSRPDAHAVADRISPLTLDPLCDLYDSNAVTGGVRVGFLIEWDPFCEMAEFLGHRRCRLQLWLADGFRQFHRWDWLRDRTDERAIFKLVQIVQDMLLDL